MSKVIKLSSREPYVLCFLVFALCLIFSVVSSEAKVTGSCSNCHTMHNSQNGQPMAYMDDRLTRVGNPYEALLIYSCLGCHSATDDTTWKDTITKAPIVFNTIEPKYGNKGLAAGNFFYVSRTDDNTGHNIFSTNPDGTLGNIPPGGSFPSGGSYTGQLRCAGTRGCHGHNGGQSGDSPVDDETQAMKGAHHGVDTPPLEGSLTNIARNYRFLLGIKGKEDSDWQEDNVNTSHNEYQGATTFGDNTTISYLCAECHGDYHSTTGVGNESPWFRHPTDITLHSSNGPGYGEYTNYTTYSMVAPVARTNPDNVADPTMVTPGTDIVMCLSCHRSHASPYFKMMRWDYKSSTLSEALSGCNVCHTSKN